ncbi:MAG: ABC transporter substrate-binding protein, partial [bacterium]
MNSIRKAAVLIGVILACNSIGACKQGEDTSKQPADTSVSTVRVRLAWLHQASYVPFHVGVEKGFYAKQRLNVEIVPSGPDLRPITPVAAGEDQFGIEGAASLIQAGAKGVPIAVVGTYLHRSPEVFIARKSDQLSEVKSWKGKRIGLWIGTHVEPLLYAMLSRAGLTKSDVDIVPAKFDISPFLAEGDGRVPIWNAYIYNEAQIPIEREIEIDIVTPESVGVRRVGEGLFTSRRFLRENPEVVERFLAATAE